MLPNYIERTEKRELLRQNIANALTALTGAARLHFLIPRPISSFSDTLTIFG